MTILSVHLIVALLPFSHPALAAPSARAEVGGKTGVGQTDVITPLSKEGFGPADEGLAAWPEVHQWAADRLLNGSRFEFLGTLSAHPTTEGGALQESTFSLDTKQSSRSRSIRMTPRRTHPAFAGSPIAWDITYVSEPGRGLVVSHTDQSARLHLGTREPEDVQPVGVLEPVTAFRLLSDDRDLWLRAASRDYSRRGILDTWGPPTVEWTRVGDHLVRHEILVNSRFFKGERPVELHRWIFLDETRNHVPTFVRLARGPDVDPGEGGYRFRWDEDADGDPDSDPAVLNGHRLTGIWAGGNARPGNRRAGPGERPLAFEFDYAVESAEMLDDAEFEAGMNPPVPDHYYADAKRAEGEYVVAQPAEMTTLTAEKAATRPTIHNSDAPHHRVERYSWIGYAVIPVGLVVAVAMWRWKVR